MLSPRSAPSNFKAAMIDLTDAALRDQLACKNLIEIWLRAFDLKGSPPPITWTHLRDLAEAFATLLAAERDAAYAEQREWDAKIAESYNDTQPDGIAANIRNQRTT